MDKLNWDANLVHFNFENNYCSECINLKFLLKKNKISEPFKKQKPPFCSYNIGFLSVNDIY